MKKARAEDKLKAVRKTAIFGKDRIHELWKDMGRCTFPTWLSPAPRNIGLGKVGKLTADQWRTFGTVHVVITMIRLWGHYPPDSSMPAVKAEVRCGRSPNSEASQYRLRDWPTNPKVSVKSLRGTGTSTGND